MYSWNKFFKLIKLPLLFAVSVPATILPFLSSSCVEETQQFKIIGKNDITIEQGKAGSEVYKLVDENNNLVDLSKYSLDFETYPSSFNPKDFSLLKDEKNNNWAINWTKELSNITDTTVKIIARDTKNNLIGSLQIFINTIGFKSLRVKSNDAIYSFLNSQILGGKQKVSVLYPNEQEAEARFFDWQVTIPEKIKDYVEFDKKSGYFKVIKKEGFDSSLSGTYEIELAVSDIGGKYDKSSPKKINFVVQNVSSELLHFENLDNDDAVKVSINYDTDIFPVNFSIPKYTDDGKKIIMLDCFSLKKEFTKLTDKWKIEKIQFDCAENIRCISNDFFAEGDKESKVDISSVTFDFSTFENLETIGSEFLANNKSFTGTGSNFNFNCNSTLNIGESFISNCPKFNSEIDLRSSGLETIPKNFVSYNSQFNSGITLPNSLKEIEDCFLYYDPLFNHQIYFHNTLEIIGNNFLSGDVNFNSSLDLRSLNKLSKIGENFLNNCNKFNSSLCIPENVKEIGSGFLHNCNDLTNLIEILCDGKAFAGSDESFSVSSVDTAVYRNSGFQVSPLSADFFYTFKNIYKPGCYRKIYPSNFQTYLKLQAEGTDSYSVSSQSSISPTEFNGNIVLPGIWHDDNNIDRKLSIISNDFFLNYSQSLKSIFIPDTLKTIMDNFFKKTKFNSNIDFSNLTLLETIGNDFFANSEEFSSGIDLSNTSIKSIGSNFMYGCKKFSISQLILPDTLQTIGDDFLKETLSNSESESVELNIPSKVTEIGNNFLYELKLGKVVINSHIKFGSNAFQKNPSQEKPTKVQVPKDELNYYNYIFKDQIDKGWIELV